MFSHVAGLEWWRLWKWWAVGTRTLIVDVDVEWDRTDGYPLFKLVINVIFAVRYNIFIKWKIKRYHHCKHRYGCCSVNDPVRSGRGKGSIRYMHCTNIEIIQPFQAVTLIMFWGKFWNCCVPVPVSMWHCGTDSRLWISKPLSAHACKHDFVTM